jgi:hypothetical protein
MVLIFLVVLMIALAGLFSLIMGIVLLILSIGKRKEKKITFILSIVLCAVGLLIVLLIAAGILFLKHQ